MKDLNALKAEYMTKHSNHRRASIGTAELYELETRNSGDLWGTVLDTFMIAYSLGYRHAKQDCTHQ